MKRITTGPIRLPGDHSVSLRVVAHATLRLPVQATGGTRVHALRLRRVRRITRGEGTVYRWYISPHAGATERPIAELERLGPFRTRPAALEAAQTAFGADRVLLGIEHRLDWG